MFSRRHCLAIPAAAEQLPVIWILLPRKIVQGLIPQFARRTIRNHASQCSKHLLFDPTCPGVGHVLFQPILPAQQIPAPCTLKLRPSMPICLVKMTSQLVRPSESHVTLFAGKDTPLAFLASAT